MLHHLVVEDIACPLLHIGRHKITQLRALVDRPLLFPVVLEIELTQHGVQHSPLHHIVTLLHHVVQVAEDDGIILLIDGQLIFPLMNQRLDDLRTVLILHSHAQDAVHYCRSRLWQ